jgi:hypothetical protein
VERRHRTDCTSLRHSATVVHRRTAVCWSVVTGLTVRPYDTVPQSYTDVPLSAGASSRDWLYVLTTQCHSRTQTYRCLLERRHGTDCTSLRHSATVVHSVPLSVGASSRDWLYVLTTQCHSRTQRTAVCWSVVTVTDWTAGWLLLLLHHVSTSRGQLYALTEEVTKVLHRSVHPALAQGSTDHTNQLNKARDRSRKTEPTNIMLLLTNITSTCPF